MGVTRTCAKCGEERLKKHFSKTQWVATHSRCRTCVKVPPGQGARAAEDLQQQLREQQDQTVRLEEMLAQANARLRSAVMGGVDYTETSPDAFICPIGQACMKDPVICADGHTYEHAAIKRWFATGKSTSPLTNEELQSKKLIPNYALRSAIEHYFGAKSTCGGEPSSCDMPLYREGDSVLYTEQDGSVVQATVSRVSTNVPLGEQPEISIQMSD